MNETFATQINQSVESLFASMQERMSVEDMQRVREAYALAAEAHSHAYHISSPLQVSKRLV